MASKIFLLVYFLIQIPLFSDGQQKDLIFCNDFTKNIVNIKLVVAQYMEQFNDVVDYKMIINIKMDTTNLYLDTFTSMVGVGHLEPFMCYKFNGKNLYFFMVDGVKWKKEIAFHSEKSEVALDDNPTWLISLSDSGITLKKGVRGYFSPPLPPKGKTGKFKIPQIINH